jgi:argininosuccinate lyase
VRRHPGPPGSESDLEGYLGLGGRLAEGPAPEMVEAGFSLECADAPILHAGLGMADLAHAVVLAEGSLLPAPEAARQLRRALLEMSEIPAEDFPYDPRLGDAWNSRHRELGRRVPELAGWLTVGRPRREAGRIAFRIAVRQRILEAHAAMSSLGLALLGQARAHRRTLMVDHTYLQPAQPTTLAYLLLGYLYPVLRDLERLRRAFEWANLSPAGAGGNAGSSLPLDRQRLASLLGFDGVVVHARDAMWQTDDLVEILAVVAGAATHASQIASDLEVFASPGFGFLELSDAHSRASALMPQKKNPYPLPVVRGSAGVLAGRLAGLISLLKTGSARTDHFLFSYGEVPRALDLFSRSERLLAGTMATLRFDVEALADSARLGFLGAADLAESLAFEGVLDPDSAHRLVGAAVRAADAEGRVDLRPEDLKQQAQHLGLELRAGDQELQAAVDRSSKAERLVSSRTVLGGSAPHQVGLMLRSTGAALRREQRWREAVAARLEQVEKELSRVAANW